jgi:hypothetical protein
MRILILFLLAAGACSRTETSQAVEQAAEPVAEEALKPEQAAPKPEQPSTPATGEEGQQAQASAVDLDAPPTVELLDAGKPPRKALRTSFEPGAKQSLRVESTWAVETVYGPLISTKTVMPSLVYELETEATRVTDESIEFGFQVVSITAKSREKVKPAQLESAQKVGNSLKGATGSFSINARGIVEDFTIEVPADASLTTHDMVDQIKQAIRLSSLPLPEEPVGKGAKWTATQSIDQRTARIRQTSTFELVDVKGERIEATSNHEAAAPEQDIQFPGSRLKPFILNELDFSGEGKGAWRLDQLGPSSATEQTGVAFKMMAREPRQEAVVMAIDTSLNVKAKR